MEMCNHADTQTVKRSQR